MTDVLNRTTFFDRFLAGLIMFFGLFMLAGTGAAHSSMIRNLDGTLGLLQRSTPTLITNIEKILSFGSVSAEAATTVLNILANTAALIAKAIATAFQKALSLLIKKFVDSVLGLFNKIISAIESWIDTLGALKDTVKSFFSALAMKVYALQECLVNKSSDIISNLVGGFTTPKENQSTQGACNTGSSGNASAFANNGDFNIQGADYAPNSSISLGNLQGISNALSNIRVSSILNLYAQEVVPSTQTKEEGQAGKGGNTQQIANVDTQAQIETKINDTSNTIAIAKAANATVGSDQSKEPSLGQGPKSLTVFNAAVPEYAAQAKEKIKQVVAQDAVAAQIGKKNVVDAAPADCKFENFITDSGASAPDYKVENVAGFTLPEQTNFADPGYSYSNATATIASASSFDVNVLTAEQCKSAERVSFTQTAAQAEQGKGGDDGFDIGPIIDSLTKTLTDLINNLISKVFNMLISTVTKFLGSIPGGEFLSQAFTEAFGGASSAIQSGVSQIFQLYGGQLRK
jgi:hypothetical protein